MKRRDQRGQAAMEFVLALMWIIALAAILFQALHFERDVFNKMGELRYKLFKEARRDQDTTSGRIISESITGKNLGDLTSYEVPAQDVDSTLHYGPKSLFVHCGSKKWFPGGDIGEAGLTATIVTGLGLDHYQDSKGITKGAFDILDGAFGLIPCGD